MANHLSVSEAQTRALAAFFKKHMSKSLDALAKDFGAEDAFRLVQLNERIQKKAAEVE